MIIAKQTLAAGNTAHTDEIMANDQLYRDLKKPVPPFAFDAAVAQVFDDMIHRSVPLYAEIIDHQAQIIQQVYRPGTRIYDLGCSTGNLALALCERMPAGTFKMVAVDSAPPMLAISAQRLEAIDRTGDITHVNDDIRRIAMHRAGIVVVNFTLQFIPPADRDDLVQRIARALPPGGILLLSEKTIHPDRALATLQVDFYHRFKRANGYSDLEISQKREALENVLIPETIAAHHRRLRRCGFAASDMWMKWFNFCSWICRR